MAMPDPTVMMQDRYLAIRTDGVAGNGTWENPYDASTAAKFDAIMSDPAKVPERQSIRLLPGEFKTTGHPGDGTTPTVGWTIRRNVRIIGSGMGVTTLKLVGMTTNDRIRYAVGMDFGAAGDGIEGFEMSDLTIDCNLAGAENTGTDISAGAVRVRGKHIFLRRIKTIGFGTKKANQTMSVITAAGEDSENCVIDDCVVDSPSSAHAASGTARFFVFEGSNHGHRFCVMRNCAGRGAAAFESPPAITIQFIGIVPGLGLGTIIEGSQIANVRYGVYGWRRRPRIW